MGYDFDELFPGRFLKAGEFQGRDVTLTIAAIETESLPQDKGGERVRGIISFKETPKKLVLNRTNGECFKALWGRATDDWIGHHVTLYPAEYQGDVAIRVKGSPDITEAVDAEIKLPRKRPFMMKLIPTGKRNPKPPARRPDPNSGEVPENEEP